MVAAVTAADLVAGARALIEPLTGYTPPPWAVRYPVESHPDFACIEPAAGYLEGDHYLSVSGNCSAATAATLAAAPVMRDTIAALLDDRDALMQRIEALEAALRDLLPLADEGAAQPGHAGSCGPWESCDSLCMDAAHDARALSAARAALRADEVAQ